MRSSDVFSIRGAADWLGVHSNQVFEVAAWSVQVLEDFYTASAFKR